MDREDCGCSKSIKYRKHTTPRMHRTGALKTLKGKTGNNTVADWSLLLLYSVMAKDYNKNVLLKMF